MKIFYISGKISGLDLLQARAEFDMAANLIKCGYSAMVVNPFDVKPFLGIKRWFFYMVNDIRQQRHCTHTVFLPNWIDSKGAVIEYFFAKFIFKHEIIFL